MASPLQLETPEQKRLRIEQEKLQQQMGNIGFSSIESPVSSVSSVQTKDPFLKSYLEEKQLQETFTPVPVQNNIIVPETVNTEEITDPFLKSYLEEPKDSFRPKQYNKEYSLDDLDQDEHFQNVANRFLRSIGTDEDIYETLRDSDYSVTDALVRAYQSGKWTQQQKDDYKYLRHRFDNADVGGLRHILEATKDIGIDIVADPLNLLAGLFVVGTGGVGVAGAGAVARIASSQAIKTGAKQLANRKGFRAVSMGLTEGAYDAGTINAGTQLTEIQTNIRPAGSELDYKELGLSIGLGSVLGGAFVGGTHKIANFLLRKEHDKLARTFDFTDELKDETGKIIPEAVKDFRKSVQILDKFTSETVGKPLTQFIEYSKNNPAFKQLLLNFRHDAFRRAVSGVRKENIEKANLSFSREAEQTSNNYATFIGEALRKLDRIKEGDSFFRRLRSKLKLTDADDKAIWSLLAMGDVLDKHIDISPVNTTKPFNEVDVNIKQPINSVSQPSSGIPIADRLSQEEFNFLKQYNSEQLEAAAKIRYFLKNAHQEASNIEVIDPFTGEIITTGRKVIDDFGKFKKVEKITEDGEVILVDEIRPYSLFDKGQMIENYLPRKYNIEAIKENIQLFINELAKTKHAFPNSKPEEIKGFDIDTVSGKVGLGGRERKYIPDPATGKAVTIYPENTLTKDQIYFKNLRTKNLPHIKQRVADGEDINNIEAEPLFRRYDSFEDMAIAEVNNTIEGTLDINKLNSKQWAKITEIAKKYKADALVQDFISKETNPSYVRKSYKFYLESPQKSEFLNPRTWSELDDTFLINNGFINTDVSDILTDYAWKLGHKIKEEKHFGFGGQYISRYLTPIRNKLIDNNVDETTANKIVDDLIKVRDYVVGGRYSNTDTHPYAKRGYDAIKVSQVLAHLPLATLSSLTEPFIALARSDIADTPAFVKEFTKGVYNSFKKSGQRFYKHLQATRGKKIKGFNDLSDEEWLDAYRAGVAVEQATMTKIEGMYAEGLGEGTARSVTNAFFNMNFLHQWTQGVQLGAYNYAKQRSIRIISELQDNQNVFGISLTKNARKRRIDQLNEIGIDPQEAVNAYNRAIDKDGLFNLSKFEEDPFYDTELIPASNLFSKEIILNPSAAELNKPMWFNSPGTAMLVQFAGYPTAFNNTVLKGFARDVIRYPTKNIPKVISAMGMMVGAATLTNWIRSGGESLKDKKDEEIIIQSFERPGLLGWLQYPLRYYEGTQYGAGPVAAGAKSISGPIVGDIVDSIAYRQSWQEIGLMNLPGYGLLPPKTKRELKKYIKEKSESKEFDKRLLRKKGGIVEDVLNVKSEPDEVKMRGLPYTYSELAGPLFQDEEERGAFVEGGKVKGLETNEIYSYLTKDEDTYNIQENNNPINIYKKEDLPTLKLKESYYTVFKGNTVSDKLNSVRQSSTIGLPVTTNKSKVKGKVKAEGKIKFNNVLKLNINKSTPDAVQQAINANEKNIIKIDKILGKEIIKATNDNLQLREDILNNDPNKTPEKEMLIERNKSFLVRHQLLKLGYDALETNEGYTLLRENQFLPTEIMERTKAYGGGMVSTLNRRQQYNEGGGGVSLLQRRQGLSEGGLMERILSRFKRASQKEEKELSENPDYKGKWGEVKDDKIYIFEDKLREAGSSGDFVKDMFLGEALHGLKDSAPEWHNRLKTAAANDPEVRNWKQESYDYLTGKIPDKEGKYVPKEDRETRPIDKWWDVSRFDQVVGGYLLGGKNANVHTMRGWNRDDLPFGTEFRKELENFSDALGINKAYWNE